MENSERKRISLFTIHLIHKETLKWGIYNYSVRKLRNKWRNSPQELSESLSLEWFLEPSIISFTYLDTLFLFHLQPSTIHLQSSLHSLWTKSLCYIQPYTTAFQSEETPHKNQKTFTLFNQFFCLLQHYHHISTCSFFLSIFEAAKSSSTCFNSHNNVSNLKNHHNTQKTHKKLIKGHKNSPLKMLTILDLQPPSPPLGFLELASAPIAYPYLQLHLRTPWPPPTSSNNIRNLHHRNFNLQSSAHHHSHFTPRFPCSWIFNNHTQRATINLNFYPTEGVE